MFFVDGYGGYLIEYLVNVFCGFLLVLGIVQDIEGQDYCVRIEFVVYLGR